MGNAVAVERCRQRGVENGEALCVDGRQPQSQPTSVLVPGRAVYRCGVRSVRGIDGRKTVLHAGTMAQLVTIFVIWNSIRTRSCVRGDGIGTEERVRKGAVGGLVVRVGVDTSPESDRRTSDCHTILAVVDTAAIRKHVDIGTLRAKFAVALHTRWHEKSAHDPSLDLSPPILTGATT